MAGWCSHHSQGLQDGGLALPWRRHHSCSTEPAAWSSWSGVKGIGLGLRYRCQCLTLSCSDEGSFAILGAAACALGFKRCSKPVIPGGVIQIAVSAASSMLGLESSSKPFSCGGSGAKSRSLVCHRAGPCITLLLTHLNTVNGSSSDTEGYWYGQGASLQYWGFLSSPNLRLIFVPLK